MFKKILLALMLVLPTMAQADVWKEHSLFVASGIKNNIDAGDCVYMLVNNYLSRFDKASAEIQPLKSSTGLTHDIAIQQIYYNYDKQYLVVVYVNSDIDVIMNDGRVENLPALYNYTLQGISKTVNDVTFSNGDIYISTGFGYMVIDGNTLETKQYNNFGTSIRSLIKLGNGLVAAIGDSLYYCPTTTPKKRTDFTNISLLGNRDISVWTQAASNGKPVNATYAKLYGINDSRFFMYVTCALDSSYMKRLEISVVDDSIALTQYQFARFANTQGLINIQPTPTGFLWNLLVTNKTYYTTNDVGEVYKSVNGKNNGIYSCYPSGDGQLWGLGATGLFNNNASTVLYTTNSINIDCPYWASYNPHNNTLYLTRTAETPVIQSGSLIGTGFMKYDGETWQTGGYEWSSPTAMSTNHKCWRPVFDLKEPNTYYVGTWFCGGLKVVNDTVVAVYDERNSTVMAPKNYYRCVQGYGLDSQGNLWLVESDDLAKGDPSQNGVQNAAMVLPADKLALNNDVTIDDWYSYNIPGTVGITCSKFSSFAIGKDDIKVYTPGNGGAQNNYLLFWRGELDEEPETKKHASAIDQYGSSVSSFGVNPLVAADSTGMVWVGGAGIFYFDPTTAFGNTLNVIRPRTSSGDIVLSSSTITHIEVDYLNRKWVSTRENGIYLLSADGTEILQHFDNSNSPMPSDLVYSSCAMGSTGRVMIMTSNGVVEFLEGAVDDNPTALGTLDVYPSLVLPQFTGYVTITGVATGSTVRIADREGNTVAMLTSEDNIAIWNTCNDNGERVETGTYHIYIAASGEEMPAEPQACVKVIK